MRYYAFSPALLVKLRKNRNMTQKQLAEQTGISQASISILEDPNRENRPDFKTLTELGRIFKVFFVADWAGIHTEENDPID